MHARTNQLAHYVLHVRCTYMHIIIANYIHTYIHTYIHKCMHTFVCRAACTPTLTPTATAWGQTTTTFQLMPPSVQPRTTSETVPCAPMTTRVRMYVRTYKCYTIYRSGKFCFIHVHVLYVRVYTHPGVPKACSHFYQILPNTVKAGSQYDAGHCVASRHASLKRCRNAT